MSLWCSVPPLDKAIFDLGLVDTDGHVGASSLASFELKFLPIHIFGIFGILVLLSHTQVVAAFFLLWWCFSILWTIKCPIKINKGFFIKKNPKFARF